MEEITVKLKIGYYKIGMWIMAGMAVAILLLIVWQGGSADPVVKAVLSGSFALAILSLSVMQVCYVTASKEILRFALQLKIESERRHDSTNADDGNTPAITKGGDGEHSVHVEVDLKN